MDSSLTVLLTSLTLFETFNVMIDRLISSGYFQNMPMFSRINEEKSIDYKEPQVLTMDHLELCFVACLIPLAVSILVYFAELIFNLAIKKLGNQ